MKKDTHPKYYPNAAAKCACGASYKIGSTKEKLELEICSNCHPFYTGKGKLIDTAGKVEKFKARLAKAQKGKVVSKKVKRAKKSAKKTKK